jgi:hypothetical protein
VDENLTMGRYDVFGDSSWKSILIGPTEQQ